MIRWSIETKTAAKDCFESKFFPQRRQRRVNLVFMGAEGMREKKMRRSIQQPAGISAISLSCAPVGSMPSSRIVTGIFSSR